MRQNKTSFTLVEVMISIAIFAIVIISASSVFILIYQSWSRNTNYIDMLRLARWTVEKIQSDVRPCYYKTRPADNAYDNRLDVRIDDNKIAGSEHRVRYRLVSGSNILERAHSIRSTDWWYTNGDTDDSGWSFYRINDKVVNDATNPIFFCNSSSNLFTINLVMRPKPNLPEGWMNKNFYFRAKVRMRNK